MADTEAASVPFAADQFLMKLYLQRTFDPAMGQVRTHAFTDIAEYFFTQVCARVRAACAARVIVHQSLACALPQTQEQLL